MEMESLARKLNRFRLSGDLHIHTNYVDGKHSIADCVRRAEEKGLELIALTEHVRRNLTYDFNVLLQEIDKAREKSKLHIWVGAEAKVIDLDGNLDISNQVRDKVDVVLGSFHSWFEETPPTKGKYLESLLNMIRKRKADIWAHPYVFLNNCNLHLEVEEVREVAQALKESRMFFEVNLRYRCPPEPHLTVFISEEVPWVIGSDAHSKEDIWDKTRPGFIRLESWQKMGVEKEG